MDIRPLSDALGAEVTDVDLSRPISGETSSQLNRAFVDNVVLCIRDQSLDPPGFLAAARHFGTPFAQIYGQFNLPDFPAVGVLTSEDKDTAGGGKRKIRGTSWHSDASYFERPPKATMLHAVDLPQSGGDTQFLNLQAAFDDLPADVIRRIDGLKAVHAYESSRSPRRLIQRSQDQIERFPDNHRHPLVRTHPETGRKAIFINPIRVECIDGLPRAESDALLDFLFTHVTQTRFEYRHKWRPGDVVMWDNRSALHQANDDYDWKAERRRLLRIMLEGDVPQ